MANTKSAKKRAVQNVKRRLRNRSFKSAVKTYVSKALTSIQTGQMDEAPTAMLQAQRALDKAAEKGLIHPNNAARRKSRLMKKLNVALAVQAP
ncbi:MAG: ribosomal protein [Dehalococcoidia bacterium]|nr:ribosomal protein [Dehalococcoidia bacterium]